MESFSTSQGGNGFMSIADSPMHVHVGTPPQAQSTRGTKGNYLARLLLLTERLSEPLNHAFRTQQRVNARRTMTWAERTQNIAAGLRQRTGVHPTQASDEENKIIQFLNVTLENLHSRGQEGVPSDVDALYDSRTLRHVLMEAFTNDQLKANFRRLFPELVRRVSARPEDNVELIINQAENALRIRWERRFGSEGMVQLLERTLNDRSINSEEERGQRALRILEDFYHNRFSPVTANDNFRGQTLNLAYAVGRARSGRPGNVPDTAEFRFFPTEADRNNLLWPTEISNMLVSLAMDTQFPVPTTPVEKRAFLELIRQRLGNERAQDFDRRYHLSADERARMQTQNIRFSTYEPPQALVIEEGPSSVLGPFQDALERPPQPPVREVVIPRAERPASPPQVIVELPSSPVASSVNSARVLEFTTEMEGLEKSYWTRPINQRSSILSRYAEILRELAQSDFDEVTGIHEARDRAEVMLNFAERFEDRISAARNRVFELSRVRPATSRDNQTYLRQLNEVLASLNVSHHPQDEIPDWFMLGDAGRLRASLQGLIQRQSQIRHFPRD